MIPTIFTKSTMKGHLDVNAIVTKRHLYDYLLYDSTNEKNFAQNLDTSEEIAVYVKLQNGFYISTPVGKYNLDWAIAFNESKVKHIYFVAENKVLISSMQLRMIKDASTHCARKHFKAISTENVMYDVVDSYDALMNIIMK